MASEKSSIPGGGNAGIRIETEARPPVIKRHDAVIASTKAALLVHGERESPIYYVPEADVYTEHLTANGAAGDERAAGDTRTRLYSVVASGRGAADAVWVHERPAGQRARLDRHFGFDPSVFNITVG